MVFVPNAVGAVRADILDRTLCLKYREYIYEMKPLRDCLAGMVASLLEDTRLVYTVYVAPNADALDVCMQDFENKRYIRVQINGLLMDAACNDRASAELVCDLICKVRNRLLKAPPTTPVNYSSPPFVASLRCQYCKGLNSFSKGVCRNCGGLE